MDEHLHVSSGSGSGRERSRTCSWRTFLLALCLQVELLAHGICLYSALVDTVSQSSKMVVPIDSPPGMNEGSLCSLPAATLFHFGSSDECNLHFFDG